MGDLVLLEDEVNPVMSALLDNGLEVTAVHNHFFFESPRIFYMHVHGHGKAADLAKMAKPAVDLIGKGSPQHQSSVTGGNSNVSAGQIDTAKIAGIVGHEGEQNGAVYKITVGRDDLKLKEMGAPINSRMGLNTWAAFYGSDANAEVAGRRGDVVPGGHSGSKSTSRERPECCSDPSPHDQHPADYLFLALLGNWPNRETRQRIQGRSERTWEGQSDQREGRRAPLVRRSGM